jgi:hypothetical protein
MNRNYLSAAVKLKLFLTAILCLLITMNGFCQTPPWKNPLKMAWSADGVTFSTPEIFQDSAGVPSVIRWKGDTLIAAFQWFRQPIPSPSWDRVATKFSYDNGITWTQPVPIIVNGLPQNYQRPFDPCLVVFNGDSIRIYFSSSDGMPVGGMDSTINTYSAKSADGINFFFEPGARVDVLSNRVIDPAVIYFNAAWHYLAPIGAPQQGAYHYVSPDGLNFSSVPNIPSNNTHNWTGNYMVESGNELRFYGCGPIIWYNYSPNGGVWSGYVNTNILGGDPGVVKISANNYLMIFVGQPYSTGITDILSEKNAVKVFPNPTSGPFNVISHPGLIGTDFILYDISGRPVLNGKINSENMSIEPDDLSPGVYYLKAGNKPGQTIIVIKF